MAAKREVTEVERKKVLLADCHEDVLVALEKMLEDTGFNTTTVWTARDALKCLESQTFDLILINEYLPDGECEDVLNALHKKGTQIPCIVMQPSAPEITDIAHLEALGACEIVYKYAYPNIVETVKECLHCQRKASLVA